MRQAAAHPGANGTNGTNGTNGANGTWNRGGFPPPAAIHARPARHGKAKGGRIGEVTGRKEPQKILHSKPRPGGGASRLFPPCTSHRKGEVWTFPNETRGRVFLAEPGGK